MVWPQYALLLDLYGAVLLDAGFPVPNHHQRSEIFAGDFNGTGFLQIGNGEAIAGTASPILVSMTFAARPWNGRRSRGQSRPVFCLSRRGIGQTAGGACGPIDCWWPAAMRPRGLSVPDAECEPFHMFEREIAEQFGVRPEGHPWLKMVRYHANYRGRPDVFGNDYSQDIPATTILCRGRRRDPRGGRGAGARRRYRARSFPVQLHRRAGAAPGDSTGVPAPRGRERYC
jgi:hypothetical protein